MSGVNKETGIWSLKIACKRHKFDQALVDTIANNYFPERCADVGCGDGSYCRGLRERGWRLVHGYEGTEGITTLGIYDEIYTIDLSRSMPPLERLYDFVLCIEVGEHIPRKHEQVFIENVCKFASKYLVLSWAIPGQKSASGHFNNQTNEYVIAQFGLRGFKFDKEMTEILREGTDFSWLKKTIMAFERGSYE